MKKLLQVVIMLATMLIGTQMAFAFTPGFDETKVIDAPQILKIQKIAIAMPWYNKAEEGQPTKEDIMDILAKTSGELKNGITVIPYLDVCNEINRTHQLDILHLERHKAFKYYKDYVGEQADAYLLVTVSNDTHLRVFFDIFSAANGDLLFEYFKQAPSGERDMEMYTSLCNDFYKKFNSTINTEKDEKAKEEKAIMVLQQKK